MSDKHVRGTNSHGGLSKPTGPDRETQLAEASRALGGKAPQTAYEKQAATQKQQAAASQVANSAQGYVWVNGQRMRVTSVNPDGSPKTLAYDNSAVDPKTGKPTGKLSQVSTVFNALNLTDIPNASAQFLMSVGMQRDAQGNQVLSPLDATNGLIAKNGHNMMTIDNGLEWFANLAVKNPDAYKAMVDQLRDSGYVPKGTNDAAFNSDAAHGFALAARDLAIVNGRPGGTDVTLDQFLGQSKAAKEDTRAQAEAAYQGVNRQFTDPAALASQAKQAAQTALGRALSPDEEKKFEAAFHGKESGMYDAIDASGRAQAGAAAVGESAAGATFTRPDASGEADQYVTSTPQLAQEHAGVLMGSYAQVLQKMVGL